MTDITQGVLRVGLAVAVVFDDVDPGVSVHRWKPSEAGAKQTGG